MATVLDVIQGIAQAAANAYDGSHDTRISHDGEAREAGLKREDGDINIDARILDGFNVQFHGSRLCLKYHGECQLRDTHNRNKFEADIEQQLKDISEYLKKEYKKITGNTLTLTKEGEPHIFVQHMNRMRTWVEAKQYFMIGGLEGVLPTATIKSSDERLYEAMKNWIAMGKK